MAERHAHRTSSTSASQAQKGAKKSARSKGCEARPQVQSAPAQTTKLSDDFLAQEEYYKLLNAEIEAKTAYLEKQTELLMKEQSDVLAKSLPTLRLTDTEDNDDSKLASQYKKGHKPPVKVKNKQRTTIHPGKKMKNKTTPETSSVFDMDAMVEEADTFLAKTIQDIEEKDVKAETALPECDTIPPGVSDAQIRVLRAKLRIMQEELDQLTSEYYKKDDENIRLKAKMKELEEECARAQKAQNIQQTQIEKYKALAEESAKKCEGLHVHVASLNKEIENLNRSNKQAAALHNTVEIRLNRAMEESQRLKNEISKMKQMNKDKVDEEHESKETLLAENKSLKKQKAELIVAFKKQLKLIDILKRQKMHFEAAKFLSFTEEEFVKALDWGASF